MADRRLLAAFAHPDDEISVGGTMARYASEGTAVTLVCATRGEVGEISDSALATPETLGDVRSVELANAAKHMGIGELIFLDYRDSGMDGTPENQDPRAFVNAPAENVIGKLVAIVRRVRPQVVLTFEPYGGYGHPDHVTISKHMIAAFHAAADAAQYPEAGPVWQADRLFFGVRPRSYFLKMREAIQAAGITNGILANLDARRAGWPDDNIQATIAVADFADAKRQAMDSHATQMNPNSPWRKVAPDLQKEMNANEFFSLAWPEATPGMNLDDLFADLPAK